MKKVLSLIVIFIITLNLAGCLDKQFEEGMEVTFYYIQNELTFGTETPLLSRVTRTLPSWDVTPEAIIRLYLNGPTSYDCISPFPGGSELVEMYIDNNRASLTLSPHINTLSPINQTIAFACLVKTVIELTEVEIVQLNIKDGLINGEESISFTQDSFAMFDSMTENTPTS